MFRIEFYTIQREVEALEDYELVPGQVLSLDIITPPRAIGQENAHKTMLVILHTAAWNIELDPMFYFPLIQSWIGAVTGHMKTQNKDVSSLLVR